MRGGSAKLAIALWGIATACADSSTAPPAAPTPASVAVSTPSLTFSSLGETAQLTATVHDHNGQAIPGATVAWVSANPSVATVDGTGLVSAAGEGATNITVTAGTTASASVGVIVEQVANTIVLSRPPDSVAVGDSVQMTAEAFDALDNAIADVAFEWSSSDTTIVTVDQEGWVRARAAGSVGITAAAGATASATATVKAVQVPDTVVLTAPRDSVAVGDSIQLTAEAFDALGNAIADVAFEWSSSDTTIVTVDQEGWVRARAAGSAEITAAAGATASGTAMVKAVQVPDTVVLTALRDSVAVGDSIQMTAEAFDALDNAIADVAFEWSSSDTTIMTVDQEGWVRARAAGSAKITVTLGDLSAATSLVSFPRERAALEAFYYATNGPEWKNNTNWLTDKPAEQWYGVETDAADKVVGLSFNKNGLTGRLPSELAYLSDLKKLSLWGDWGPGNSITGPIPAELAGLSNLTVLKLGNNELTGEIPPELANLTNLTNLSLVQNKLTGRIPPGLGRLTNLERLSLGGNALTGEIPPELGNLTRLRYLYLPGNALAGDIPAEIWNLVELTDLYLGNNDLTGEISPEVANLVRLEILSLHSTAVTGRIPPEVGGLSQLRWIWMPHNNLTGSIPPELGNLHNLEILLLGQNNLSGSIPPELGDLSRLETLSLGYNPLTGEIPPELGRLAQLEGLFLDDTRLSGPIPPQLGNLPSIEKMFLGGDLTGRIPPELGNLVTLQRLEVESHSLQGPIPPELGKLTNLTILSLIGYGITGTIPPELGNLGRLEYLSLAYTGLTGSIPPEIGNLANLQVLQLVQRPGDFGRRGAAFTGPLPSELGNLSELRGIRIGHHAFTGPLPRELGNLANLTSLIIAQSQGGQSRDGIGLTGPIPPELRKLTGLKVLSLDSNHLSGTVPPELGSLAELRELHISNNDLDGRVPDTFLNLHLDEFWWHNNPLCLPATPAFQGWRGRIRSTLGPSCAGSATAARRIVTKSTTVEPVVPCRVLSDLGSNETGAREETENRILTGSGEEVSYGAASRCPGDPPDR